MQGLYQRSHAPLEALPPLSGPLIHDLIQPIIVFFTDRSAFDFSFLGFKAAWQGCHTSGLHHCGPSRWPYAVYLSLLYDEALRLLYFPPDALRPDWPQPVRLLAWNVGVLYALACLHGTQLLPPGPSPSQPGSLRTLRTLGSPQGSGDEQRQQQQQGRGSGGLQPIRISCFQLVHLLLVVQVQLGALDAQLSREPRMLLLRMIRSQVFSLGITSGLPNPLGLRIYRDYLSRIELLEMTFAKAQQAQQTSAVSPLASALNTVCERPGGMRSLSSQFRLAKDFAAEMRAGKYRDLETAALQAFEERQQERQQKRQQLTAVSGDQAARELEIAEGQQTVPRSLLERRAEVLDRKKDSALERQRRLAEREQARRKRRARMMLLDPTVSLVAPDAELSSEEEEEALEEDGDGEEAVVAGDAFMVDGTFEFEPNELVDQILESQSISDPVLRAKRTRSRSRTRSRGKSGPSSAEIKSADFEVDDDGDEEVEEVEEEVAEEEEISILDQLLQLERISAAVLDGGPPVGLLSVSQDADFAAAARPARKPRAPRAPRSTEPKPRAERKRRTAELEPLGAIEGIDEADDAMIQLLQLERLSAEILGAPLDAPKAKPKPKTKPKRKRDPIATLPSDLTSSAPRPKRASTERPRPSAQNLPTDTDGLSLLERLEQQLSMILDV